MRYFRIMIVAISALALSDCTHSQRPLNPPSLATARDTDVALQLFMQATILLGRYYDFHTLQYEDLQDRSVRHGLPDPSVHAANNATRDASVRSRKITLEQRTILISLGMGRSSGSGPTDTAG